MIWPFRSQDMSPTEYIFDMNEGAIHAGDPVTV